jgi:SAM-dependent methyltransferase
MKNTSRVRQPAAESNSEPLSPLSFYERKNVLENFWRVRDRLDGPKLAIEEPALLAFLGDLRNRSVLDLGCGDARLGREVFQRGARSYLGLDGSREMLEIARQTLAGTPGEVRLQDLESWRGDSPASFDVVASQLAMQYVKNFSRVFQVIRTLLEPKGLFVFSIEHPIITSSYEGDTTGEVATNWRVHGYFREGERVHRWLDSAVVKQHRTLETYISELCRCGFQLTGFSEGRPQADRFADRNKYELRLEVPVCVIFRCTPAGE